MNVPPLPDERQADIRARLIREGRVVAAELAAHYQTSEDTIRRDLREMASAGLCRRVYGGALPMSPASGTLVQRIEEGTEAKEGLGRAAAGLVAPGQLVFIDAGSTNLCIAQALPSDMALTVATNAPSIATVLLANPGVSVLLLGGRVDPRSGGALGAKTLRDAQQLRPDLYFVGACAVDRQDGVAVFDAEEAQLKQVLVEVSRGVAAAVTREKIGTGAPYAVAPWRRLDHLVVERPGAVPDDWRDGQGGPRIHHAASAKDRS